MDQMILRFLVGLVLQVFHVFLDYLGLLLIQLPQLSQKLLLDLMVRVGRLILLFQFHHRSRGVLLYL